MNMGVRRVELIVLALFVALSVSGCGVFVSGDEVAKSVEKQGYRDVQIMSKHIFFVQMRGCGKDDEAAFKATAVNPLGQRVGITICSGWLFKGVTVRT